LKFHIIYIFLALFIHSSFAGEPIIIKDNNDDYLLVKQRVEFLEDPNKEYTIDQVSSAAFVSKFSENPHYQITNKNIKSAYWVRFKVADSSTLNRRWIIELFDFRIDNFDLYLPDGNGGFSHKNGGDIYPFNHKYYKHKNFVFDLPPFGRKEQTYYFRVEAKHPVGMIGTLRSSQKEMLYSTNEYLLLALFYGVVLAMILYNLFLFLSLKDPAYIFYVLYVLSIGVYGISEDGLGFEYLWPQNPEMNNYVPAIAIYCMVLFVSLYARSFLDLRIKMPLANIGIILWIVFRTILFILGLFINIQIIYNIWIDLIPLTLIYLVGIISWKRGFRPARFYVIAFTVLFGGFVVAAMQQLHIIEDSIFSIYSFNFGVFAEMILLSFALADRIKVLMKERAEAQNETIIQLQEKENLKDKVNRELEEKVLERTAELKDKNEQLDDFVYKASHDIKGPLRSIIGLTTVGLKEIKDPASVIYFEEILKSTKKLDTLVTDLLELTKVKEVVIEKNKIDFDSIIAEVLKSFRHFQGFEKLEFDLHINQSGFFYTDEKMLYSIVQNLIENAIKYRDPKKENPFLKIEINADAARAALQFTDNGLGIQVKVQSKIFDMFYKVNPSSSGTGLGLYIVKTSVEKLGGNIGLKSDAGIGSSFLINLENYA
jgi:signal transduction histidine kinase